MVAGIVARRPIGFLACDGGADRRFFANILEAEFIIDRGKTRLLGQRFAHRDRLFALGGKLGPNISDQFVVSKKPPRDGNGCGHPGQALGQRIDHRDIIAAPDLLLRPVFPATMQIYNGFASMHDGARGAERFPRQDRCLKSIGHRFKAVSDITACPWV